MKRIVLLLVVVLVPWWASEIAHRLDVRINLAGLLGAPAKNGGVDDFTPPPGWDERRYLAEYPDVVAAVRTGQFFSGYEHFKTAGEKEGRRAFFDGAPRRAVARPTETAAATPSEPAPAPAPPPAALPAAPAPLPPPAANPPPPAPPAPLPGPAPAPSQASLPPPKPAPPEPTPAPALAPPPPPQPAAREPEPVAPRPEAPPSKPALSDTSGRYVVREGGALARVAELTGVSLDELRAANPAPLPGWLPPGTVLQLPGRAGPVRESAAPPPPPPPPPVPDRPPPGRLAAATPEPPRPAPAAAPRAGGKVQGIRFGRHTDSVRVVLDTSQPLRYQPSLQPDGRTIQIDLPDAAWAAALSAEFDRNFLFQSYRATQRNGGSRLVLTARRPVSLKHSAVFTPNGPFGHRVVFDIAPR